MEFQQLRALIAVADAGSVTEAARRLYLTQPAVTRQVLALEKELGGPLFDRTRKPLSPTPLGRTALDQARRILQMSEDLRTQVSSEAGALRGPLRLGVAISLARPIGSGVVLEMRRRYPEVQVFMTSNWSRSLCREVEDGTLDAAVVIALPQAHNPPGLTAVCLTREVISLVCATSASFRGAVPLEALRGTRWILDREGCGYRTLLRRTLEGAGIPFVVAAEVSDMQIQFELIARDVGLGILPRRGLPPRPEEVGLRPFGIQGIELRAEVRLLHRSTGAILPVVAPIIVGTVRRLLRGLPARTRAQAKARG